MLIFCHRTSLLITCVAELCAFFALRPAAKSLALNSELILLQSLDKNWFNAQS